MIKVYWDMNPLPVLPAFDIDMDWKAFKYQGCDWRSIKIFLKIGKKCYGRDRQDAFNQAQSINN